VFEQAEADEDVECLDYLYNTGKLRIYPMKFSIPKGETKSVRIEFFSQEPEHFSDILEFQPRFGETVMLSTKVEVQEPVICLNRYLLDYPKMYANKIYTVKSTTDPNCIILRNLGNIPSKFQWEEVNNEDIIQSALSPMSGVIEAKSEIQIKLKFTVKLYGKF
jgi:hypothetical protein